MLVAASVAGTVADLAVAIALVPRHGALGAGAANAAAQVAASLVVLGYAARFAAGVPYGLGGIARGAAAATAGGLVAHVAVATMPDALAIPLGGIAGVAVYLVLVRLLRVVPETDREWLAHAAGSRGRWAARLLG